MIHSMKVKYLMVWDTEKAVTQMKNKVSNTKASGSMGFEKVKELSPIVMEVFTVVHG